MISLFFMDKAEKDIWLPILFDLYYENMSKIAPSGSSYQQERTDWLAEVSSALDKEPRRVLLCTKDNALLGYIQYYTRDDLLMVEEVQIARDYHRTFLFFRMCRFLSQHIPPQIQFIEAYADRRNIHSQKIMRKLGMVPISYDENSIFVHLRGHAETARKRFH